MTLKYLALSFLIFFNCQAINNSLELSPERILHQGRKFDIVLATTFIGGGLGLWVEGLYNLNRSIFGAGTLFLLVGVDRAINRRSLDERAKNANKR